MHDVCSTVHALALVSPALRALPLADHGLELVQPEVPLAHPLDDGHAALLHRSVDETADALGGADGRAYRRLLGPLVSRADDLMTEVLGPLRVPRHPLDPGAVRAARRAFGRRAGVAPASTTTAPGRCSPAPRRTR